MNSLLLDDYINTIKAVLWKSAKWFIYYLGLYQAHAYFPITLIEQIGTHYPPTAKMILIIVQLSSTPILNISFLIHKFFPIFTRFPIWSTEEMGMGSTSQEYEALFSVSSQ